MTPIRPHTGPPAIFPSIAPSPDTLVVVALDPGGTTGYAACTLREEEYIRSIFTGQREFNENQLYTQLEIVLPDIIICESFEYRNRARSGLDLTPVNLIGVVKLYCQRNPNTQLYMQSASTAKGFYSNEKLKALKLYKPAHPHAMDALRHLLHWINFGAGYQYIANTTGPAA